MYPPVPVAVFHGYRRGQVLTQWPKGNQIAAVGFSRFEAEIEPELQELSWDGWKDHVLQNHLGKL